MEMISVCCWLDHSANYAALSHVMYVGFMLVIIRSPEEGTNSLLMKRPSGCVYLIPLGAVSSTERPDILKMEVLKPRRAGNWSEREVWAPMWSRAMNGNLNMESQASYELEL